MPNEFGKKTNHKNGLPKFKKKEIWKMIDSYVDYSVSNYGRITSFKGRFFS